MDDAMIAKLLQTYGAPATVKNANAARAFFATNPEIAEKRAMGLRGSGLDDNSDIFGAQLEKFMQEAEAPAGKVEVGQPQLAEQPAPQRAATQQAAPAKMTNTPAAPGASRQAGYEPPVTRTTARPGGGFGLDDILTAILGISSVAGRKIMGGGNSPLTNVDPNDPRLPPQLQGPEKLKQLQGPEELKRLTYQPKLEDGNKNRQAFLKEAETTRSMSDLDIIRQKYGLTSEEADQLLKQNSPSTVTSDPALTEEAKKRQLQAEIDSENADAKRLQDQIMERQRAQIETKKLSDAAKRSVGRR